ncbi:allophanate hydrolase subunit 1 [Gordonia alkaliphila]|uniref:Allophanate hydrolase subunit 1 n=1 Tax=Gordonia alkaliphila TaxID=1053547 RepID=A0ABP8YUJ8_9ACTN|nr:carboxyltransferase domain-containing protein [Gordonia alkaliphila]MCK0439643.1 allophanate hydrolase subunit 1 [Gordonia alkaliphila]
MRELPAGDDAVVLDFSTTADPTAASRAAHTLRAAMAAGTLNISDAVPTATAVLVQAEPGTGLDVLAVRRILHAAPLPASSAARAADAPVVHIPVRYDGADLNDVAAAVGLAADEVIAAHTAIGWRVQFMGFAPGFGYLVPATGPAAARAVFADLTRRTQSRPAVPAGAVAVAAGYSAVYPRTSPGGWFLLGRTDIHLWDVASDPPALLAAGTTVRFECAD